MKFLKDLDFKNKRVLLRTDYNVPMKSGLIIDDQRIRASIETINYILSKPKSRIVIVSHLGRPDGKRVREMSLRPITDVLSKHLKREVTFIEGVIEPEYQKIIRSIPEGSVALLENIRFYPQEELNDEDFAIELCRNFGIYVNDAFSVCHRAHASVVGPPKFKPSCIGINLEKEIYILSQALSPKKRPAVAIVGGVKVETKLPLIQNLSKIYDVVLIGGTLGIEAQKKGFEFDQNVIVPEDYLGNMLDIGPVTMEKYDKIIRAGSFIIWNGAMGKFEETQFARGTETIMKAIVEADAVKIAGGGETVEAINQYNLQDKFDFISTGGAAMLDFLAGKVLPGIKALEESS